MGNTHRQKVTSKVIFLLHCTALAQLSFYSSLEGGYNFTLCNHTAIKTDYQNMLEIIITNELSEKSNIKHIKNCCIWKREAEVLGCIYHFTKTCLAASEIWNFTHILLKEHCHGNSKVNGSQNQQWRGRKCKQTSKYSNYIRVLLELREMWYRYQVYEDN